MVSILMNTQEYLFTCLAEECAEISQAAALIAQRCSKINRFGLYEIQTGQDKTNLERLKIELNKFIDESIDFIGVLGYMFEENILPENIINYNNETKVFAKVEKIKKYMEYSKKVGCLNE